MRDRKKVEGFPADRSLIDVAQRVEYYEIAASASARNLASHIHQREVANLLTWLGEENNAARLLSHVEQTLMSELVCRPAWSKSTPRPFKTSNA